jgi:hypothetical protein
MPGERGEGRTRQPCGRGDGDGSPPPRSICRRLTTASSEGGLLTFVGEVSAADHGRVVHGSHVVAAADVDGAVVGPHAFGLVLALAGLAAAVILALRVRPHFLDDAVGARLGEASVFPSDGVVVL